MTDDQTRPSTRVRTEGALVALDVRSAKLVALVGSYEGRWRLDRALTRGDSRFHIQNDLYSMRSFAKVTAEPHRPSPEAFETDIDRQLWRDGKVAILSDFERPSPIASMWPRTCLRDVGPPTCGLGSISRDRIAHETRFVLALGSYEVRPTELAAPMRRLRREAYTKSRASCFALSAQMVRMWRFRRPISKSSHGRG